MIGLIPSRLATWLPTLSMLLVSLISYIDRNTLALLAPTILRETGLSGEQYGYIISAFSVAYMFGNPVWGVVLDRFGIRWGMLAAVSVWTFASASHAFATGFLSFAAARALLGFGEGATFPGGLRTVVLTLPADLRSRGIAVAYSGGSLGAIVTPILITPVALTYGWRGAFWFTGVVGCCWIAWWWWVSKGLSASPASLNPAIPWRDPRLRAFLSAYSLGALPLAFVLYGASIYLSQARGLKQSEIGFVLWIPPLGWEIGYFFWGWVCDRFRSRLGFSGMLAIATVLGLPLALAPMLASTGMLLFALFFAMFIAAAFVIVPIAYATASFSSGSAGFIAGAGAGSWSAVVALLMPAFGRLFDTRQFNFAFAIAAIVPIFGFLLWRYFDSHSAAESFAGQTH